MDAETQADSLSSVAEAIGDPARARMLCCLLDNRARTSTELAMVAGISPSTASAHLARLKAERLVLVAVQGKHRYYTLEGPRVARALEALSVLAGTPRHRFEPTTPTRLRAARTCYDHIAGSLGVALHDRFQALGWLTSDPCDLTSKGARSFEALGLDIETIRAQRRRFAYPCLDWSERRPHLGGALASAILTLALQRKWVEQDLEGRALSVTARGRRELAARFGITIPVPLRAV
jgi:DNA-binding transcriptional ArsR family regulator